MLLQMATVVKYSHITRCHMGSKQTWLACCFLFLSMLSITGPDMTGGFSICSTCLWLHVPHHIAMHIDMKSRPGKRFRAESFARKMRKIT